jgi:hypothetical protein
MHNPSGEIDPRRNVSKVFKWRSSILTFSLLPDFPIIPSQPLGWLVRRKTRRTYFILIEREREERTRKTSHICILLAMTLTHEESILVHARVVQCMEIETEYVVNVRILNAMWAFAHARMTFDENEKVQHNAHVYSWLGNITFKHVVRYRRCSCMHMAKGQTYHAINLTDNLSASESIIRIIKTVVLCFYCSLGAGVVTHACGKCRYRKYLAFAWNCAALFTILASHSHK